jgi:hypothetical protein
LENYKIPHYAVSPVVGFVAPNQVSPLQLLEQRNDVHRVGREDAHPQADRLPLEHPLIVALVPQADEKQARVTRHGRDCLIGPEAGMNAANASHSISFPPDRRDRRLVGGGGCRCYPPPAAASGLAVKVDAAKFDPNIPGDGVGIYQRAADPPWKLGD